MTETNVAWQWETTTGAPVRAAGLTLTPQARALTVQTPWGGFVWNRPVAVLVEREGRTERRLIFDMTRLAQVGLIGLSLSFTLAAFFFGRRRR